MRKQQAGAILAARRLIVKGAVVMVTDALTTLTNEHKFELDDERKATMIGNLLVVICGDQPAQPVVNTGSLYSWLIECELMKWEHKLVDYKERSFFSGDIKTERLQH